MRFIPVLAVASLASADVAARYKGPEIWGSYNKIEDCEMDQAIECLQDIFCERRNIPYQGKIRCTIGESVAHG